jgi:hypothetical protein
VADWVSQTSLSAIHKTQFGVLKQIPADKTFDHKKGLDLYNQDASAYMSVDLSAATDRLPRILQARIIDRLYTLLGMNGSQIAQHWLSVVDRTYITKNSLLEKISPTVRYSVGQGMGLFSSWSSMALMHHFIVSELCRFDQDSYALVGDDLLLKNDLDKYAKYLQIMSEIGVSVNQSKTLVSTQSPHTVEFARNYIIMGHKITPLPLGVIFSYYDAKLSGSEVFCNFKDTFYFIDPGKLLDHLNVINLFELHTIAYYLYINKICDINKIRALLSLQNSELLISEDQLSFISEITKSEEHSKIKRPQIMFIESLLSQCSMRREEDLAKVASLGDDFAALRFAGDQIIEDYSDIMRERILGAVPITYLPGLGNPTTTKRERRLIYDYLDTILPKRRTKKTTRP